MLFDFFSARGISSKLDKQRNLISSRNNRLGKKPLVLTFTALCFPDLKNKFSVLGRWKHFSEIKNGTSESLIISLVNSKIFIFKTWLVRLFESMKKLINNHFNNFIENSLFISIWTGNYCVVYFSGRASLINFKEDKRERDRVPYSTIDLPSELYRGAYR